MATSLLALVPSGRALAKGDEVPPPAERERQAAFLFLSDDTSLESMLSTSEYAQLARAGGAAMLSVRTAPGDEGTGAFLTIGAGARSAGPADPLHVPYRSLFDGTSGSCGGYVLGWHQDLSAYRVASDASVVGALAGELHAAGITSVFPSREVLAAAELLVAVDRDGRVFFSECDDVGFQNHSLVVDVADPARVRRMVLQSTAESVLVIVASPTGSPEMEANDDILPGIVVAEGPPQDLFPANGPMGTLTSTTTRRAGLVSNEDIAPTILAFFDVPIPSTMKGAPIEIVETPPPVALHQRAILSRQRRTPMAVGTGIVGLLIALAVWVCSRRARRGDVRAATIGAWLTLSLITLPMALLAVGTLAAAPMPVLVGCITLITLGVPAIAMRFRHRGRFVPPAIVGGVILAFYLVDAALNSPSQLTTFLGSQGFDGGRYFGMHNISLGLILGASLFIAGTVKLRPGMSVLIGSTLLIGLPFLGADNGGSVTLAFAAGLWFALHGSWRRLRWIDALIVAGWTVAGTGLVLVADVVLPQVTHGARFVEVTSAQGPGAILEVFVDRLMIGVRLLAESPAGIVYLVLLPVLLYFVVRPRPALAATVAPIPEWRAAIATMLAASVVAFIANDTGVTASGLGVASAIVALVYASLTHDRHAQQEAKEPDEAEKMSTT